MIFLWSVMTLVIIGFILTGQPLLAVFGTLLAGLLVYIARRALEWKS